MGYRGFVCTVLFLVLMHVQIAMCPTVFSEPSMIRVPQDYPTIQQAVDAAADGDTILVAAGPYNEDVWLYDKNSLTLNGENRENTIINGGVALEDSDNITISNFTVQNGYHGHDGIWLVWSQNNTIADNIITNNSDCGLWFERLSVYNTVCRNIITKNRIGVLHYYAGGNTFFNNTFADNFCGVDFFMDASGVFFHNNFINNTCQSYSNGAAGTWNVDYPVGGNYWDTYVGSDLYSGVGQNVSGSDGIGDTPYYVFTYTNSVDYYPLVKPVPWAEHDIAVTGLVPSKTVVGQGYSLPFKTVLFNYGSGTEVFNVTVFSNETLLDTFLDTALASRNSTSLHFTWNTTGFAYGNYTLSAYATPAPEEADTTDNTRISVVHVGVPGDLNADKTVNVLDAVILAAVASSKPDNPNWNPNADINTDFLVNIFDAVILAAHAGQQE